MSKKGAEVRGSVGQMTTDPDKKDFQGSGVEGQKSAAGDEEKTETDASAAEKEAADKAEADRLAAEKEAAEKAAEEEKALHVPEEKTFITGEDALKANAEHHAKRKEEEGEPDPEEMKPVSGEDFLAMKRREGHEV